jgi:hypothetical protein
LKCNSVMIIYYFKLFIINDLLFHLFGIIIALTNEKKITFNIPKEYEKCIRR